MRRSPRGGLFGSINRNVGLSSALHKLVRVDVR